MLARTTPTLLLRATSACASRTFTTSQLPPAGRERLLVLGSGWGSYNLLNRIDQSQFQVTVVSPRNHFLFTPLLASTTTGTLDFRSIIEPIRQTKQNDFRFYMGHCEKVDLEAKKVTCREVNSLEHFELTYDRLVIGVGADSNDFGIPGVKEHAYFLKELKDARRIRSRIVELFEKASIPTRTIEEQRRLLHIVIVGGGPTGVEFAGELSDFFWRDLTRYFPDVPINEVKITLLEASHRILPAFDQTLVKRAVASITKAGVYVRTDTLVRAVTPDGVVLSDGSVIKCGMVVWSTGIGPRPFVKDSPLPKTKQGRIQVDEHLRVLGHPEIFAMGDCAEIEGMPLVATAQVARQQGAYLANELNESKKKDRPIDEIQPFRFRFLGLMLYAGHQQSIFDSPWFKGFGILEWFIWRSVYLMSLGSLRNRAQVPAEWLRTIIWGRDVTSFGDEIKDIKAHGHADTPRSLPSSAPSK